jgi:4-amino-4-deoxychorismate lyase
MGTVTTWIDGIATDQLPADDRGLHYGDGLFETIRIRNGSPRFLEAHLARLVAGCERLRLPFTAQAEAEIRADIARAVAESASQAILKVIVTRGSARRRGYAAQGDEVTRRVVSLHAASEPPADAVDLALSSLRLGDQPALAGLKHLNRLENVLAATGLNGSEAFDVVLQGTDGRLISGATCNLFLVRGHTVFTPAVDRAGVAGIVRGIVLRESPHLKLLAAERDLTLDDLRRASEAFVTNARIGVVPVRRVGQHAFTMHTVSRRIAAHVETLDA